MKLLWILVLAVLAWRLFMGRWPWELKRGIRRSGSLEEARRVLGLRPDASRDQIVEAHRRRIAAVHPDRGGSNEAVHEANAARDALLAQLPDHTQEQR